MFVNKNSAAAVSSFSEQLDVEGRSLWQDARRRFMHNRAALVSLCILFLIALFVIFAPILSPFAYDDTDWGMMSAAPALEGGTTSVPTPPGAICWCVSPSVDVFR